MSQDIFPGMPGFGDHPPVKMEVAVTHEMRQGLVDVDTVSPVVHSIQLNEHTGTHVDAFNHFGRPYVKQSVDTMPLSMFLTSAFAIDLSMKNILELITPEDLENAINNTGEKLKPGDTLLIHTDHYRKHYNSPQWNEGPGLSLEAVEWLSSFNINAFAVETLSPGIVGQGNKEIHTLCGEKQFTHYENVINIEKLIGRGRFLFIALPLKLRGGTGSPVRAVAFFQ